MTAANLDQAQRRIAVDVRENPNNYEVIADMPGVSRVRREIWKR